MTNTIEKLDEHRNSFDVAILQDVLEHVNNASNSISRIAALLKPNGLLYISTPNRWSPLNILSDPHWNLPIVAMLPRKGVRFIVQKILKRGDKNQTNVAALFSFKQLQSLLTKHGFEMPFINRQVAEHMLIEPQSVLNCPWHLKAIALVKRLGLSNVLLRIVNDKYGLFNRFFNPTWYILARKL